MAERYDLATRTGAIVRSIRSLVEGVRFKWIAPQGKIVSLATGEVHTKMMENECNPIVALSPVSTHPTAPRVAVVLPCYNEGATIAQVVTDFRYHLPQARILVFDNASTDNTATEARSAGAEVRVVPLRGKGNVVRRIFADVDADIYVMVDGDGTYDAAAGPSLRQSVANAGHGVDFRPRI